MKKIVSLVIVVFIFMSNVLAQNELVKYENINGKTFKISSFEKEIIQEKEEVFPLEDGTYRSLDYFEQYNEQGKLIFKGNKISGFQTTFYSTGEKESQGGILNSKREGRWAFTNKEKQIERVEIYINGELTETINY